MNPRVLFIYVSKVISSFNGHNNRKETFKDIVSNMELTSQIKKKSNKIEVAIVTRNRSSSLKKLLDSLISQTVYPNNIIIVNNGSTDDTKSVINFYQKILPIRIVLEKRQGIPFARNKALENASTKLLAFIDDDCVADRRWVEQLLIANKKHPKAAAFQGVSRVKFQKSPIEILTGDYHWRYLKKSNYKVNLISILDTKNACLRVDLMKEESIRFDERFYRGQDVDLAKQIINKKKQIVLVPGAKVFFESRRSLVSFLRQRFHIGFVNMMLKYKWSGKDVFMMATDKEDKKSYKSFSFLAFIHYLSSGVYSLGELSAYLKLRYDFSRLNESVVGIDKRQVVQENEVISILIITKDDSVTLIRCLNSLLSQTVKPDQVVIVDASYELQSKIVEPFKSKLKIDYVVSLKAGYSTQRNLGLRYVKGKILAIISSDCEAAPDWVKKIKESHKRYPYAVAIQGRLFFKPEDSIYAILQNFRMDSWMLSKLDLQNNIKVITTKNVSFKIRLLKKYKLKFHDNPAYNKFGGEDMDLGFKLERLNLQKVYDPSIVAYHWEKAQLFEYLRDRYFRGSSSAAVKYTWPNQSSTILQSFNNEHLLAIHLYNFISIPRYLKKNGFFLKIIQFVFLWIISNYIYHKGRNQLLYDLNRGFYLEVPKQKKEQQITADFIEIGVVSETGPQTLQRLLNSLYYQSIKPKRITIVDINSNDNTQKLVDKYKKVLPVRYFYEKDIPKSVARNILLKRADSHILAMTEEDCVVSANWIESIIEAHLKYPQAIGIQGQIRSTPFFQNIFCRVSQFNRLNLVLKKIKIHKDFFQSYYNLKGVAYAIESIDIKNISFKLINLNDKHIQFDEEIISESDVEMGKRLKNNYHQQIIFYPKIILHHWQNSDLFKFLGETFLKGMAWAEINNRWQNSEYSVSPTKIINDFRSYIIFSPKQNKWRYFSGVTLFGIYQTTFYSGMLLRFILPKKILNLYTYKQLNYNMKIFKIDKESQIKDDQKIL